MVTQTHTLLLGQQKSNVDAEIEDHSAQHLEALRDQSLHRSIVTRGRL
jgi:hypothetical protein